MIKVSKSREAERTAMREAFCQTLIELAEQDPRVVLFEADLMGSMGTKVFQKRFPDRCFNCGIAEACMVGAACGASVAGLIPFTHTFGPFATRRVNDQVFMSGAYAGANVKMVGSDAGITAAYNGGTHMPFDDAGIMRGIPNMTVLEFTDTTMLRALLPKVKEQHGMFYLRMARKLSYQIYESGSEFVIGKAAQLREGTDAVIFAMGYCVNESLKAAEQLAEEGVSLSVYDMFTLKPLDEEAILREAARTGAVITAENHSVLNGLGSAVAEVLAEKGNAVLRRAGIQDTFGEVGSVEFLAQKFGIDAAGIAAAVRDALAEKNRRKCNG